MLYRPVDSTGDMFPIARKEQLLFGTAALAEAIKSRMRLHRGEWWEEADTGSPILDLLTAQKVSVDHMGAIAHQIVGYISQTEGVRSVQASQPTYNQAQRSMTLLCVVTPTTGEAFSMEVSTNI